MAEEDGFLSRWSRRKVQVQSGAVAPEVLAPEVPVVAVPTAAEAPPAEPVEPAEPPPTLADVEQLTHESDYSRFVAGGVDRDVKNAALKKLFTDPHFNVMDGLDTYIDDYGKPDPLPADWLRKMTQTRLLGLFTDDEDQPPAEDAAAVAPPLDAPPDEDIDLRLQPHDGAGRPGLKPGAAEDPGRQH